MVQEDTGLNQEGNMRFENQRKRNEKTTSPNIQQIVDATVAQKNDTETTVMANFKQSNKSNTMLK